MTDAAVSRQVRLWNELAEFCDNVPIDKTVFRSMWAVYTSHYKRLSWAQQGEVSHVLQSEIEAIA